MVFLHGWPGSGLMWRAQLDSFAADGWHCIAPDLRGFGRSSIPAVDTCTTEEVVPDLVELHDHLGANPRSGSVTTGAAPSPVPWPRTNPDAAEASS